MGLEEDASAPPLARAAGSGTGARPETARMEPVIHCSTWLGLEVRVRVRGRV